MSLTAPEFAADLEAGDVFACPECHDFISYDETHCPYCHDGRCAICNELVAKGEAAPDPAEVLCASCGEDLAREKTLSTDAPPPELVQILALEYHGWTIRLWRREVSPGVTLYDAELVHPPARLWPVRLALWPTLDGLVASVATCLQGPLGFSPVRIENDIRAFLDLVARP